jgi:hypothetical protein
MRKLLYLMLLLPLVVVSQENESFLLNLSEITVKTGHTSQFIEGVKSWKKCYMDNDGKDHWNMWHRVQGEGSVFTMTSTMAKWAEMDDDSNDTAGKECRTKVIDLIMPHVKSVNYNIARSMPKVSRTTPFPEDAKLVWVYNVKTSNSSNFMEAIKELSAAMKKAEGDTKATWYNVMGGEGADYFVAVPYKNFAELDVDSDGVWKVYEKANGKAKTDALKAKFRASVSSDWSYMYTLNKELSN